MNQFFIVTVIVQSPQGTVELGMPCLFQNRLLFAINIGWRSGEDFAQNCAKCEHV